MSHQFQNYQRKRYAAIFITNTIQIKIETHYNFSDMARFLDVNNAAQVVPPGIETIGMYFVTIFPVMKQTTCTFNLLIQ